MKRIFPLLCALLLLAACGPALPLENSDRLQIVAAVFPAYDFARAAAITRSIAERLETLDPENGETYRANAGAYARELEALDRDFAAFFDTLPDRTMVFGDRFPLLYFAEAYDLDYYAAFPGCGAQTEPSAATVAFLTEKARGERAVWYIEFSNHLVADSIAEAAGTETALFHTCHNVSRADLEAGVTYVSLMRANLETLERYL